MTEEHSQQVNNWISESIEFFRKFGFLSREPEFEDWRMEYFESDLPDLKEGEFEFLDQLLLGKDKKRVWNEDWEVWNNAIAEHKQAVERWSEISRGAFDPKELIVEAPEEVEGVLEVSFQHRGKEFTHRVQGFGWIDPTLLVKINEIISDTDTQFYALDTGDQSAFIVALKAEEREEIEAARGWNLVKV